MSELALLLTVLGLYVVVVAIADVWWQRDFWVFWPRFVVTSRWLWREVMVTLSLKASRPKPYLRGSKNGMYGRRGILNPNYKDGGTPERQQLYATAEWSSLVRSIYKRDGYKCRRCGIGHTIMRKLHAHHIVPWAESVELRFVESNLVTLCNHCHVFVHSKRNVFGEFIRHVNLRHKQDPTRAS